MAAETARDKNGPLRGVKVIELAGNGPAPFGGMLLADLGADVVRVDRPDGRGASFAGPVLRRGRRSSTLDLKQPDGAHVLTELVVHADALIEPFRPGVAERLGIGPDDLCPINPRLIYARMTGWGQHGPLARRPGRDINYISVAGALHPIGRENEPPTPPLNLLGDFGGGGMLLAFGIVAALLERSQSGKGQVIDVAMLDGAALLMTMFHELRAQGEWSQHRGTNYLDTGAPFYETYRCSDGRYVAVGAIDQGTYIKLLSALDIDVVYADRQYDASTWPQAKRELREAFARRPRDAWCRLLHESDAGVSPVLTLDEAHTHPHNKHRRTFLEHDGVWQPAPAPRFSRTPASIQPSSLADERPAHDLLQEWAKSS